MLKEVILLCLLIASISGLPDLGAPGWSCDSDVMKPSNTIPKSAHQVRFGDIKIVAALGDSLTAANGAGARKGDAVEVILQYRGLAFQIGGDKSLDEHITLPNVLRKFNPSVFGFSNGIGSANVWEIARLNQGIPGAETDDLPGQARTVVALMNSHKEINVKEDWKLVNIFIGANDICGWCNSNGTGMHATSVFKQNIIDAVQILKDNLPRTIVSLTGMMDMTLVRVIDKKKYFCDELHVFECSCEKNPDFPDTLMRKACQDYMQAEQEIQDSGMFDTSDDFTFVIQPFLNNVHMPPLNPDGTVNMDWFAPDCFHFSQLGHANVGKHLWNTIIQPVGFKQTSVNLSDSSVGLHCPNKNCPYFPTTKNINADCANLS